jgi:hypothetical protein
LNVALNLVQKQKLFNISVKKSEKEAKKLYQVLSDFLKCERMFIRLKIKSENRLKTLFQQENLLKFDGLFFNDFNLFSSFNLIIVF